MIGQIVFLVDKSSMKINLKTSKCSNSNSTSSSTSQIGKIVENAWNYDLNGEDWP
jgi:hypothetical protein